ncbi:DUF948 domain-containing protein [Evansella sp. AB-rgal1]|uniref:DUF948 domain-containing protein n=1 Tax=Evansella sp. AB-rgal1 TaxID=3242696 RepID=UPI00359D54F7
MDWLGIGVLVLAIGFMVLVIFLIPVLKRLEKTLGATAETIEKTQKSMEELTSETTLMLFNTNETILDVNNKLTKLDPLFQIVHDTGESAHHLASSIAKVTKINENKNGNSEGVDEILDRRKLEGLVRGAAFIYYLREAKKVFDKRKAKTS